MVQTAVVHLLWSEDGRAGWASGSTGFVFYKDNNNNNGLYILSTAHQLADITIKSKVKVEVTLYNGSKYAGTFINEDSAKDVSVCALIGLPDMSKHPLSSVEPIQFSKDVLYPLQEIYTIHHPTMTVDSTNTDVQEFFRFNNGIFIDNSAKNMRSYGMPDGKGALFDLTGIMPGSSGAPIFANNSDKVVSMVVGYLDATTPGTVHYEQRHLGASLEPIFSFLKDCGFDF